MAKDQSETALRMLSCPKVCEMVGCSKSTLYAKVAAGKMPRPIKIGGLSRWIQGEIVLWLQEQILASRNGQ